jgi:hypothetical protein
MPSADTRRNSRVSRNGVTPVTPVTPPRQGSAAPESPIGDSKRYTEAEARTATDEVKMDMEDLWRKLKDLHDRRAWMALGYASWKHYSFAEFNISKSYAYRLINAAKVEDLINAAEMTEWCGIPSATTPNPKLRFNEAQLRELGKDLNPQAAWSATVKQFGDNPTAAQIKDVVDARQGPRRSSIPEKLRAIGSLTLSLARPSMIANGASTCRVSASLVDKQGQPFEGQKVAFGAFERANGFGGQRESSKVQIGDVKDHGDGTYSAVLTAGKETGHLVIRAHVETEDGGHVRGSDNYSYRPPGLAHPHTLSLTARKQGIRVAVLFKQLEPDEIETLTGREFESLDDLRNALNSRPHKPYESEQP